MSPQLKCYPLDHDTLKKYPLSVDNRSVRTCRRNVKPRQIAFQYWRVAWVPHCVELHCAVRSSVVFWKHSLYVCPHHHEGPGSVGSMHTMEEV